MSTNNTINNNLEGNVSSKDARYQEKPGNNNLIPDKDGWLLFGENKYRGQLKDGIPHGLGEMKWQDCTMYNGNWVEGRIYGYGTMTWPSGKKYEGDWKDGVMTGRGKMYYPNGNIYEGEFEHGLRNGVGTLHLPNGDVIEGFFYKDQLYDKINHYDSKGTEIVKPKPKFKLKDIIFIAALSKFWSKTWQLWLSLTCFALAALFAMWVYKFFSGQGPSIIRRSAIVAPFVMVYYGFKFLISFIQNISK